MGTLNWTLSTPGTNPNVMSANDQSSGAFTTSTSAAPVTSCTPHTGQTIVVHADEAMWIRFGGRTAAVGTGYYIPATTDKWFEITTGMGGAVSTIDVA